MKVDTRGQEAAKFHVKPDTNKLRSLDTTLNMRKPHAPLLCWAATLIYAVPMQAQHKERVPRHLDKASIAAIGESKMHIDCSVPGAGLHPVSWY